MALPMQEYMSVQANSIQELMSNGVGPTNSLALSAMVSLNTNTDTSNCNIFRDTCNL